MGIRYLPTHPWYYFEGGRILDVAEIPAARGDTEMIKREDLTAAIVSARKALDADIVRYNDLIVLGVSEWERSQDRPGECKALHVALSLVYSHISYHKGVLVRLRGFLGLKEGDADPPVLQQASMF